MGRHTSCSTFGVKLQRILDAPEKYGEIVCWLPCGRAFRVHDTKRFKDEVLPAEGFKASRYEYFQRQLNYYGFSGMNNVYRHPTFARGATVHLLRHTDWRESRAQIKAELKGLLVGNETVADSKAFPEENLQKIHEIECAQSPLKQHYLVSEHQPYASFFDFDWSEPIP